LYETCANRWKSINLFAFPEAQFDMHLKKWKQKERKKRKKRNDERNGKRKEREEEGESPLMLYFSLLICISSD
jgi:hypothetical protein